MSQYKKAKRSSRVTDKFMQWMGMRVAQTVADTDIREEVTLPTNPAIGLVMAVHSIQLFCGQAQETPDGNWVMCYLTTADKIVALDYTETIDMMELHTILQGAAGLGNQHLMELHDFPVPFLIAHPKIWIGCSSNATGTTNTAMARIGFTFEYVTPEEFFQALAAFGQ